MEINLDCYFLQDAYLQNFLKCVLKKAHKIIRYECNTNFTENAQDNFFLRMVGDLQFYKKSYFMKKLSKNNS